MDNEGVSASDAIMIAFCIWRGIHETKKEADEIDGELENSLTEDLRLVQIAMAIVKPEFHEIMKMTLGITARDIREGRI